MDTKEVAAKIGTTPRQLRAFLRSDYSTFRAVGSGSRYDFTEREVPTIAKRFGEWKGAGKPRPETAATPKRPTPPSDATKRSAQRLKDADVWAEEGPVVIADIRDPRVRAQVRRDAQAAQARLEQLLIANGLHVAQAFLTTPGKAS